MDMRRLVGENVARWRQRRRLTQEKLAEKSGLSQQYLSGLEQGKRNPTILTLFELAQALDTTPADLLKPSYDEPTKPIKPTKQTKLKKASKRQS